MVMMEKSHVNVTPAHSMFVTFLCLSYTLERVSERERERERERNCNSRMEICVTQIGVGCLSFVNALKSSV